MDLKKYIYGHCVSPKDIKIWDSYSQSFVVRSLPCGKCLHCKNTSVNEWCTRLVAQTKYSSFIYYVSLDYAPFDLTSPVARQLARETAACYHNINKYGNYGMHPLVLCKNHLQDFFKRFRKNTQKKIQYFACGEYGMHANGRGYGRPHFHCIIFSNSPISETEFADAWTLSGYRIGRVDFQDLTSCKLGDNNQLNIFRYVCKYLQKTDFNFENLATVDFHRAYFTALQSYIVPSENLFENPAICFEQDSKVLAEKWREYIRLYSPFVVCSRRPSIGAAYLADNLERFKAQDFRLFGLPKTCATFPRYYVRRTKESLYPVSCIGEVSQKPTTNSRMGYILQILRDMYNARLDFQNFREDSPSPWCVFKVEDGSLCYKLYDRKAEKCSTLNFYDVNNKFLYQFNGYNYNIWAKLNGNYALLDNMDIYDVLKEFAPSWDRFYNTFIVPMHDKRILQENELYDTIKALYKPTKDKDSFELFADEINACYQAELENVYKTKLLMQNSKQTL